MSGIPWTLTVKQWQVGMPPDRKRKVAVRVVSSVPDPVRRYMAWRVHTVGFTSSRAGTGTGFVRDVLGTEFR